MEKVPQGRLRGLSRHSPGFGERIGVLNREMPVVPAGLFVSRSLPRTASWAKFSRPCGTDFAIWSILTHVARLGHVLGRNRRWIRPLFFVESINTEKGRR